MDSSLTPDDYDPPPSPDPVGVRTRARRIVDGPPGTDPYTTGRKDPQWQITLTWDAFRVPSNNHLWPGQLVTIDLTTMGGVLHPMTLPLRSINISFPVKSPESGEAEVVFSGKLPVLQLTDPWQIWSILRRNRRRIRQAFMSTYDKNSTSATYGGLGQFTPSPAPNGSVTEFDLPLGGYIAGTLQVYRNGLKFPVAGICRV